MYYTEQAALCALQFTFFKIVLIYTRRIQDSSRQLDFNFDDLMVKKMRQTV